MHVPIVPKGNCENQNCQVVNWKREERFEFPRKTREIHRDMKILKSRQNLNVICTVNSAKNIRSTLKALLSQLNQLILTPLFSFLPFLFILYFL